MDEPQSSGIRPENASAGSGESGDNSSSKMRSSNSGKSDSQLEERKSAQASVGMPVIEEAKGGESENENTSKVGEDKAFQEKNKF